MLLDICYFTDQKYLKTTGSGKGHLKSFGVPHCVNELQVHMKELIRKTYVPQTGECSFFFLPYRSDVFYPSFPGWGDVIKEKIIFLKEIIASNLLISQRGKKKDVQFSRLSFLVAEKNYEFSKFFVSYFWRESCRKQSSTLIMRGESDSKKDIVWPGLLLLNCTLNIWKHF